MSRFVYQHDQLVLRAHCSPHQQSLLGRVPRHHLIRQLVNSVSPLVCRFWRNIFPTPHTYRLLVVIQLSLRRMHTLTLLNACGFDDGKRVGIFQRTEQFSDIVRCLNSFLLLRFPGGAGYPFVSATTCARFYISEVKVGSGSGCWIPLLDPASGVTTQSQPPTRPCGVCSEWATLARVRLFALLPADVWMC